MLSVADEPDALGGGLALSGLAWPATVILSPTGVITGWSHEAERLFGYSANEIIGVDWALLIPSRQSEDGETLLRRVRRGEWVEQRVGERIGKDGAGVPVAFTLAPILGVDGEVSGIAWTSRRSDIGAVHGVDPQSRQAHRLEGLGRLAGGVAHDFNNIVGVILNFANFMAEHIEAARRGEAIEWDAARRDVAEIERAARRAALLTRQLLAFARRDVIQPRVIRINDMVTGVQRMVRKTLGPEFDLVTDLGADRSRVLADPGQMEQLLLDLVVNARDAMPGGGTLTIATDDLVIDGGLTRDWPGVEPGPYVRVRVSDTGVGMSPEVLEHAFEPFFSTKQNGMGSGLGLATVYGIVTHADGHVRIDSQVGQGTTFTILLPATDEPLAGDDSPSTVRAHGGETVLVVEDEEALREATRRMFSRNGYEVITAENGRAALEIARTHPGEIHLLVTDVVMPHMLGREVAERVRVLRPGIGVLYMSGYAESVLTSQGRLDAGVVLLEKPFGESDLLAKVAQVLNGHAATVRPR
jgi:PAS domain S-box-containing protein